MRKLAFGGSWGSVDRSVLQAGLISCHPFDHVAVEKGRPLNPAISNGSKVDEWLRGYG